MRKYRLFHGNCQTFVNLLIERIACSKVRWNYVKSLEYVHDTLCTAMICGQLSGYRVFPTSAKMVNYTIDYIPTPWNEKRADGLVNQKHKGRDYTAP